MRDRLFNSWVKFRGSFWFVPALMTTLAIILSFLTIAIDDAVNWNPSTNSPFGYAGRPEGARALLSAMAGSTITAAATAFSVTIATLVLASSQFGPRLLRNFISDIGNQVVLGTFIGTFAYCLLVLRTVHGTDDTEFVPQISLTVAVVLSMASIAMLIYFIHHVATSIQVTSVVGSVSHDLNVSIDRLYKEHNRPEPGKEATTEEPEAEPEDPQLEDDDAYEVPSHFSGYIQTIDIERIVRLARESDVIVKLTHSAGSFVLPRGTIAMVWPKDSATKDLEHGINSAFTVGADRTPTQDVEFALDQLVEIAVRALSPGVNDPFTALSCIDRLGSALVRIVERKFPDPLRRDGDGNLRVIAAYVSFGRVVDAAFNQIRHHGSSNPVILLHMLETIAIVARRTENEDQRDALLHHTSMIWRASESLPEITDRQGVEERYRELLRALHRVREEELEAAEAPPPEEEQE